MKYIRTKDGQIIYIGYLTFYKNDEPYTGEGIGIWEGGVPIIKEADTIEELCDALVVTGEYEGKEFHRYFPTASDSVDDLKKRYGKYGCAIYGAIWTRDDRSILKCVAKMNEKGELELL